MPVGIRKPFSAGVVSLCVLVGVLVFASVPALASEPLEAPVIESESSSGVGSTEARLEAVITPGNSETAYHFEYGSAAGSYGVSIPVPEAHIHAGLAGTSVSVAATGLEAGTTYHYRVVASNALPGVVDGPDYEFTTSAAQGLGSPSSCPNEQRRAEQPYGLKLPDCRAYEMVSPVNSEGQDATDSFLPSIPRASVSGEAITYGSRGAFADPKGAIIENQLVSWRGTGGWSTQNITPLHHPQGGNLTASYDAAVFTPELTEGIANTDASLTGQQTGAFGLYVANFLTNSYQYVGNAYRSMGASTDLSHVVLGEEGDVSEWLDGTTVPVSVGNEGEPLSASVGDEAEAALPGYDKAKDVWHAVSGDGSRVYFTSPGFTETTLSEVLPDNRQLYLRVNTEEPQSEMEGAKCKDATDACTIDVSASQRKEPDPHGPHSARYWGASADGAKVFFTSDEELTEDAYTGAEDNAANLYEYDLELPEGKRLKDLTGEKTDKIGDGAMVQGVVQISEDGQYIYFIAEGALTGPHGEALRSASGAEPIVEENNLYVSREGGAPVFIATLEAGDRSDWHYGGPHSYEGGPEVNTAAVSPGGRHLAFLSYRELTGYDNHDANTGKSDDEIFLYEAESGKLVCASCNPTGASPAGSASLKGVLYQFAEYRPRDMLEDGALFFDSSDALVAHASDGRQNVYEYEDGHVYAISDVAGGYESFFMDASANGENAFFGTADQLLPEDTSNNVVVWDARVGGGFPVTVVPSPCDNGDSCKPPPTPQPALFGAPASAAFSGPGNIAPVAAVKPAVKAKAKPVKCKRGFVRDNEGKCVQKKKRKNAKKSVHANRGASR